MTPCPRRVFPGLLLGIATLLPVGAPGAWGRTAAPPALPEETPSRYAGLSLADALARLQRQGLRVIFTSNVVRPGMTVSEEPTTSEPRQVLAQLLEPHGLAFRDGPGGTLVVVFTPPLQDPLEESVDREEPEEPDAGPASVIAEELVVTPSRISLLREEPVGLLGLTRDEILSLPHLGDDFYRALSLLPGTAANDVSAQFHIRGGWREETQILLDGQELFEAFHLKDFDNAMSFVAPGTLDSADLVTGGFAAQYGDRMSGVLEMHTLTPSGPTLTTLGVGILGAHAGGQGSFAGGRGSWIAQARRGSLDLVGRLLGDEDPSYWDAFAKVERQLKGRFSLRGNLLASEDELDFDQTNEDGTKRYETEYGSLYLWLTGQTILGPRLYFDTALSRTEIDRDRRAFESESDAEFLISDVRDSEILALRQGWHFQPGQRHSLRWGWETRAFDARYDYFGARAFDNPLAIIRHDFGEETTSFAGSFDEHHDSLYLADRLRLTNALTAEAGLRWDRHSQTDESHVSPRLNLAYALGERTVLRGAWGRFNQSQRPYELQVEDGETTFQPVERAEHRVVGLERILGGVAGAQPLTLRLELYQREVDHPRPRFVNLYEPINTFPEVEPDRVLIAAQRSRAEGVELFLRGRLGRRARWWMNYTLASTEDRVEDDWVPRLFDQEHTLNLNLDLEVGRNWRLSLAWRYHTGWPTTPLNLAPVEDEEGEVAFLPELGPLNSERLPDYHRLDLRASRRWKIRDARVEVFIDLQNVYDRSNVAGFDFDIDEELGTIEVSPEEWAGFLPSAGISVQF